jgi:hypothetical protein
MFSVTGDLCIVSHMISIYSQIHCYSFGYMYVFFFMTICMCYTANLFFTLKKDLCIVGVRTSQTKSIPRRSAGDQLVYRLILTQHSPSGLFSQRAACYEGMDNPQNKNITSVRWLLIRVFASTETLDY